MVSLRSLRPSDTNFTISAIKSADKASGVDGAAKGVRKDHYLVVCETIGFRVKITTDTIIVLY